ncbi:OapC/ArvC family zinc-ribbon domain-containing protein [Haloarcula salina]|uniref:OapC/ArvC family zinc-ribbon domain-containing protein n=1 Tax=Haloarcula salina TaxID=1429914 RepID=UPI003C6F793A
MPHQCTNCGRGFDDGSKEMLSGCPDCGGNKFQFQPEGVDATETPDAEPPEPPGPDSSVARTVGKTAASVRDFVSGSSSPDAPDHGSTGAATDDERSQSEPERPASTTEDAAQASARGDIVEPDELPSSAPEPSDDEHQFRPVGADPDPPEEPERDDRPDLQELREELNDQFESIKVLEPGQYELNLMELYDREEYIIALQEDGRYSIQVPDPIQSE